MNNWFNQFRKSGKIEHYMKYREEMSKELTKEKEYDKDKGNHSKRDQISRTR